MSIQNPFMANKKLMVSLNPVEITLENVSKHFKKIFVLVKKTNKKLEPSFFMNTVDEKTYNEIVNEMVIWETSLNIIKNKNLFEKVIIMHKDKAELFNNFSFELSENNLVLPILNISFKNINSYLSNVDGISNIDKIYSLLIISNFLGDDNSNVKNNLHLQNLIKNMEESFYWTFPYNCLSNLSRSFKYRKFNNNYKKLLQEAPLENTDKEDKIDTNKDDKDYKKNDKDYKKNEDQNEDYLKMIFKNKQYVDASSAIQKSGYKLYYINNDTTYTKEDINNLFQVLDNKNKYYLFCNMLISKKLSDLVINNKIVLEAMTPIIREYAPIFKYLIGYSWLKLYFDESIKKSKLKITDETIFNIHTASKLPVFPFCHKYPKSNPYMPIMVDNKILNSESNINGLGNFKSSNSKGYNNVYGICDFKEFKRRFNIFTVGNPNADLFQDIEWQKSKIAISGSIMTACLPLKHPLTRMFHEKDDDLLTRYFNEYYALSDIDVMFLTNDPFEYMENVTNFYNQLIVNICNIYTPYATPSHVHLVPSFQLHFFVKETWIKANIVNDKFTYDFIVANLDDKAIQELFKPIIKKELENKLKEENNLNEKSELYKKYPHYFQDIKDYTFKIYLGKDETKKNESEIYINYKYKIISPHLNRKLELFMSKGDDHMNLVSQFHLPCVRALYNGDNVYLTPSCISAYMTFMNIDYKYFAGSKDPIDIINKNRMRGFGTWLNQSEINALTQYSSQVDFWSNLYGINPNTIQKEKSILGCLSFKHKLIHPRLINADKFYEVMPVNLEFGYNDDYPGEYIENLNELNLEMNKIYPNIINTSWDISHFNVISDIGAPTPVEKWLIEAYYESKNNIKSS